MSTITGSNLCRLQTLDAEICSGPQEAAAAVQLMNGTPFKDIVLQASICQRPPGNIAHERKRLAKIPSAGRHVVYSCFMVQHF